MIGIDTYKTKDAFTVVRLHYTADPAKRSPGAIAELAKGYPGGRTGAAWRKEMEIDFTAYSGQLLCYDILCASRGKIVRDRQMAGSHLYGSLDWGRNNPASFHVYAVDHLKHVHSCYEIYLRGQSIPEFSALMKACPHYKDLLWISADPSLWAKNQETKEGLRSLNDLFRDEGIILRPGSSRDDMFAINELLDRWSNLDKKEPRFTISPRCAKQVWEFERLRYKELTTASIERQNPHEQLMDKDNHSWDDFKYFISTWLTAPKREETKKTERGSVQDCIDKDAAEENDWRKKFK